MNTRKLSAFAAKYKYVLIILLAGLILLLLPTGSKTKVKTAQASPVSEQTQTQTIQAEEQRLKERRDTLTRKEDRLMKILDRECAGQKTPLGIATLNYRKTSRLEVTDAAKAVAWLKRRKYLDCFRVPAPEVAKTEVKKLINSGVAVPGCAVVEDYSCSLK